MSSQRYRSRDLLLEDLRVPLYREDGNIPHKQSNGEEVFDLKLHKLERKKNRPLTLGERIDKRKKLVERIRWIVSIEFVLAMAGIILMMVEIDLVIDGHIKRTDLVYFVLKYSISVTTVVLLIMICINYYTAAQIRILDEGVKEWTSIMSRWDWFFLFLELGICAIHPYPGDIRHDWIFRLDRKVSLDTLLSILMLFRVYIAAKLAVVQSKLMTQTAIHSIGVLSKVKINTLFVFKAATSNKPGQVLICVMITFLFMGSWAMRTCEIYYDNEMTYHNALWIVANTFLTIGNETPQSYCGRYLYVLSGAMGMVTMALLVAIITRLLEQTRAESYVFNFVSRLQIEHRKKVAASNAIKAAIRISILQKYDEEELRKEKRKYDDKLKQALKGIKNAKEEIDQLDDSTVGLVDVAHSVDKIGDLLDKKFTNEINVEQHIKFVEQRLASLENKIDDLKMYILDTGYDKCEKIMF